MRLASFLLSVLAVVAVWVIVGFFYDLWEKLKP